MISKFTVDDGPYKKYEYPKCPFSSATEVVEAHNQLKASVVPALWDGRRIIPCGYDPMHDQAAAEAISPYYFDVGEGFRLAGSATVLIDKIHALKNDGTIRITFLHPYVDKDPFHMHTVRVVHNAWMTLKVDKVTAEEGYSFCRYYDKAVPDDKIRTYLGDRFVETVPLKFEIVDKAPDMKEEICNDVLAKEMQEEFDRQTLADMVKQINDNEGNCSPNT